MEPLLGTSQSDIYRTLNDSARARQYQGWLDNESARMALDLYARAWALTEEGKRGESARYFIALVPDGNNAAVGMRLETDARPDAHAHTPFIKLAPEDWAFATTFLHETGHVVLDLLAHGAEIPKREIVSIPHSTAALTDRGTAFDEGFAIYLETLAAHLGTEPYLRDRYHRERFRFGVADLLGEYHRQAGDLLSFSQTIARYQEVRDNTFAFAPAYIGPDYLRVQLEKSRDFSRLRNPSQLLQSEGFCASLFFGLTMRGATTPSIQLVHERQSKILAALTDVLNDGQNSTERPFLLDFVSSYARLFPAEAGEIYDVLLDLSHDVFVDSSAAALWRTHYLGALRVDLAERNNARLESSRQHWRDTVSRNPRVLYSRLGPQLRAELRTATVTLVAMGETKPVSFDVNTVEEGVIRVMPKITDAEVAAWLTARESRVFSDPTDFRARSGLRTVTLASLRFSRD